MGRLTAPLVACALAAVACEEPCPLHEQQVTVADPDQALSASLTACGSGRADAGAPAFPPSTWTRPDGAADPCSDACARVFQLAVDDPRKFALLECRMGSPTDGRGAVTVTLRFRARCG